MGKDKRINNYSPHSLTKHADAIDKAYKRAVREALLMHKRAGNPVAIWRDGKVVLLQPDEIDVAGVEE